MNGNMEIDQQAIGDEVRAYASSQSGAAAAAAGGVKDEFCRRWPDIKSGLEILRNFVPATVKAIISIVITAGDAAHGAVCRG